MRKKFLCGSDFRQATLLKLLRTQLITLFSDNQRIKQQNAIKNLPLPAFKNNPKKPIVLLLHTHTSESYLPYSGCERTDSDKKELGDIIIVGEFLKKELETKYQIPVVHCKTIHDSFPFRKSYDRSLKSVKKYLKKYPTIKVVLDVHRDAAPDNKTTCSQKYAKLLFVVGTDQKGLKHPYWKLNHTFAEDLVDVLKCNCPELDSDILVAKARYNQHLHPNYLILEAGDHQTTMIEVQNSITIFAEALSEILKRPIDSQ